MLRKINNIKKKINNTIIIPNDINIILYEKNNYLLINGKLGSLKFKFSKFIKIEINNNIIIIKYIHFKHKKCKSLINTTSSLIKNSILGVTYGYKKKLILFGIGYKAELKNDFLVLSLGFSHNILYKTPNYLKISCINNINIIIEGIDKQLVGQTANNIRNFKVPDSYKGKGIKYENEKLFLKESKKTK